MKIDYKNVSEDDFRKIVLQEHLNGNFRGDPHKMEVKFKRKPNSIGFVSVVGFNSITSDQDIVSFCGLDIFPTKEGVIGFIHCLGVPKSYRGQHLSNEVLQKVEDEAKKQFPELKAILSVCNPISAKTHTKNGYIITHPGRLSKTGKLMQIRLRKDL